MSLTQNPFAARWAWPAKDWSDDERRVWSIGSMMQAMHLHPKGGGFTNLMQVMLLDTRMHKEDPEWAGDFLYTQEMLDDIVAGKSGWAHPISLDEFMQHLRDDYFFKEKMSHDNPLTDADIAEFWWPYTPRILFTMLADIRGVLVWIDTCGIAMTYVSEHMSAHIFIGG